MRTTHCTSLLALLMACRTEPDDTGTDSGTDTGDSGETGDTGETGETGETGDTGAWECDTVVDVCDGEVCAWDLDVPLATVGGTLTVDGAAYPAEPEGEDAWALLFRNRATGVVGTRRYPPGARWSAVLAPGTWDISFQQLVALDGGLTVDLPVLVHEGLVVPGDEAVDLVVNRARLGGRVTFEGGRVPDVPYTADDYLIELVDLGTGATRRYAFEAGAPWEAVVDEGTYSVTYLRGDWWDWADPGDLAVPYPVQEALVVRGDTTVDIDVRPVLVGGSITLDGEPLTEDYEVELVEVATSETFYVYVTAGGEWSARLTPGTYDIFLDQKYPIARELVVESDTRVDAPLTLRTVSGTARWNGGPMPDEEGADGYTVMFVVRGTWIGVRGDYGHDEDWSLEVADGEWDVLVWRADRTGEAAPMLIPAIAVEGLVVDGDRALDLDVQGARLWGSVRVAGGDVPDGTSPTGSDYAVWATQQGSGERAYSYQAADQPWSFLLPVGVYDLTVEQFGGTGDPVWLDIAAFAADDIAVAADRELVLEVDPFTVGGAVVYAGGAVPDGATDEDYTVRLLRLEDAAEVSAAFGHQQGWSLALTEGTYTIDFSLVTQEDDLDLLAADSLLGECISVGG